jgi:periplasmic copper chaperone A
VPPIRMRRRAVAAAATAALALPATAAAHVTLQPSSVPADGYTRLDVRVPNERDNAGTVKIDVQFPPGFESVSYEPRPGWKVKVQRDGDRVSQITWSGGRIGPGEFVDFGLSLRMPKGEAGEKLTFKALQTYDDGQVVRWIGPEDADEPAPIVTLEVGPAGGGHGAPAAGDASGSDQQAAPASPPAASSDDGGTDTLALVAVVLGALALIAALGALAAARRGASSAQRREEVAGYPT